MVSSFKIFRRRNYKWYSREAVPTGIINSVVNPISNGNPEDLDTRGEDLIRNDWPMPARIDAGEIRSGSIRTDQLRPWRIGELEAAPGAYSDPQEIRNMEEMFKILGEPILSRKQNVYTKEAGG